MCVCAGGGGIQTAASFLLRLSAQQRLKGNEMPHWGAVGVAEIPAGTAETRLPSSAL